MEMKERKVRVTFTEELLGTASGNKDLHRDYIASKAPDAEKLEEEVEALGVEGVLRKVPGTKASKIKAYKKEIDGLLFVFPRKIPICAAGPLGTCVRSLRASSPMGERTALATSETIPAGSTMEFTISCLTEDMEALAMECLEYGILRGMGQWRNSGKGRFTFELLEETPKKPKKGKGTEK